MKQEIAKEKCFAASQKHRGLLALLFTVAGSLCIVVCLLLLLAHGTTSVVAYFHSLDFVETSCIVKNITLLEQRLKCNCRDACRSTFPCLLVQVDIEPGNATTVLYHKDTILNNQCSYEPDSPCSESEQVNDLDVQRFHDSINFSRNTSFRCLYNPSKPEEVILTRTSTTEQIVMMLVVPSIFLLISVSLVVIVHRYFGAKHICHMISMAQKRPTPTTFSTRKISSTSRTSFSSLPASSKRLMQETIAE